MHFAYKYRLYPTKAQAAFLEGQLREACDLYNCALQERRDAWKTCRKSIGYFEQCGELSAMRNDGCLSLADLRCAQDVLRRVEKAYRAFFSRVKRGEKPGFPRYRSWRRYDSITFPQYPRGARILPSGKLFVHGAGHVKLRLHRPREGSVKTATIKREAGRWFVVFSIERDAIPLPRSDAGIGVDVGLTSFATLSDGTEVDNPRYAQIAQSKLRRAQRKVSRRNKGSNRRRKAVRELQRTHSHVRNQRADFHHKVSRDLVNRFGLIAVEDLHMKGLASGILAKPIRDASWASFIQKLSYKAECAGRELVKVEARGTSQTCTCGAPVPKTLKQRWHHCPACGLSADRDHVSAQIILSRAGERPSGANVEVVNSCVA